MQTIKTADLALKLGYKTPDSFSNSQGILHTNIGLPKSYRRGHWDLEKVEAWMNRMQELDGKWDHSKSGAWLHKLRSEKKWDAGTHRGWCAAFGVGINQR